MRRLIREWNCGRAGRRAGGQAGRSSVLFALRLSRRWEPLAATRRRGSALASVLSVLSVLTVLLTTPAHAQKALAKRLDALLDAPDFAHQLWGVALLDRSGKLIYSRNADRLFIPASNTKLVVTSVAASRLAPDFAVQTSVYAAGAVDSGIVYGDLVLYGRGDPTSAVRCYSADTASAGACDHDPFEKFRALAEQLRAAGISEVKGDLVGDGSYFEPTLVHGDWSGYDLNWWYAAPVSGLSFNDNSVDLYWRPGASEGMPAQVVMSPFLGDVSLENRSRTTAPASATTLDFFRTPGTLSLWAEGDVALDSWGGTESFALPDPNLFAARAFRQVLGEAGITIRGTTASVTDSLRYRAARATTPLATVTSRPLSQWIFPILSTSQNFFAEMLLKQLGRQFGTAGSWEQGLAVERRFLVDSMGVDSAQVRLSDGSGLAAMNLVSPLTFARILQYMRHSPHYAEWSAGLPRAGQSGTLSKRFIGTPLDGRVLAKTGTIGLASTLSGYIFTERGDTLTFSIQANHHSMPDRLVKAQIDSLVLAMAAAARK
jgi:D-alanyl-D-alanine carboxypeptidase/D-alanyl-D-alanine-endopeptidase (penicillin-binding protein 4)